MSETPDASALAAVRAALEAAWRDRSPAEQAIFGAATGLEARLEASDLKRLKRDLTLVPAAEQPAAKKVGTPRTWSAQDGDEVIASFAEAAERIAAVSGAIDPRRLAPNAPDQALPRILDRVASAFDRRLSGDSWLWTLKSDRRAAVLNANAANIRPLLAQAEGVPTDAVGEALRDLLRAGPVGGGRPIGGIGVAVQALSWAAAAFEAFTPQLRSAQREASMRGLLRGYDHILGGGFFGREPDVSRLRSFVMAPRDFGRISILTVEGVGGAGKSTLLANALRPLILEGIKDPSAPIVITMDFDRGAFQLGGELELSFELSRQLAVYLPELAQGLAELRAETVIDRTRRGEFLKSSSDGRLESSSRHGSEFDYRAADLVRPQLQPRHLVLVLDTFEEWQRARRPATWEPTPEQRVFEWISSIQGLWDVRLAVIVSGRAPLPPGWRAYGRISLRDLKRQDAVALARAAGLPQAAALKLCRIVGGNPLTVKLAARYVLKLPARDRAAFLADPAMDLSGLDEALRQGVLYKRFLEHVQDPRARRLAHPGLALRRVTRELIRDVLARPCGLGPIDDGEADELFGLLEREVWLVERKGEELAHRPEARRAMLRAMADDPALAPMVAEVHRAAADWYDRTGEGVAEALYHRLALAEGDWARALLDDVSLSALATLARNAGDFPEDVRVQVLFAAGRRLSAKEARLLPDRERRRWVDQRAQELVAEDQPQRALDLWRDFRRDGAPGPWLAAAKFGSCDWTYDPDLMVEIKGISSTINYAQHYLLVFVLSRVDPHRAPDLREQIDRYVVDQWEGGGRQRGGSALIAQLQNQYFGTVADGEENLALSRRELVEDFFPRESLELRSTIATTYQRCRALTPFADPGSPRDALRIVSGAFQPTWNWVEGVTRRMTEIDGVDPQPLRDFIDRFQARVTNWREHGDTGKSGDNASSAVLGKWADRFADSVVQAFGGRLLEEDLYRVVGPRSDDPEWRSPLRTAFASARLSPDDLWRFAETASHAIGPWRPHDMTVSPMVKLLQRSPRTGWLRVLEYVDRCRGLGAVALAFADYPDERLSRTCGAYLDWDRSCNLLAKVSRWSYSELHD